MVYGEVIGKSPRGEVLFSVRGIAIYPEVTKRKAKVPLTPEQLAKLHGPIRVEYRELPENGDAAGETTATALITGPRQLGATRASRSVMGHNGSPEPARSPPWPGRFLPFGHSQPRPMPGAPMRLIRCCSNCIRASTDWVSRCAAIRRRPGFASISPI